MKKTKEPKRKVGKSMEADIEMIERCLDQNDDDLESDHKQEEEEESYQNLEESENTNSKETKSSKDRKAGFAKSVSWSESEENTPRFSASTSTSGKDPRNLGARPKTGKRLNPLIRQKQSLEDGSNIMDEIGEIGEDSSVFTQETSTSATVTKTTSVVKRSSTLMEKIRQRSSQSRTRSAASEEEDTTDSDDEDPMKKNDGSSSDEDQPKSGKVLEYDEEKEIEEEENRESLGPLKTLSSSRKKSSSSSTGGDKKGPKRPALQKQGSRYDIRLKEEDQSAQVAFDKRQESRKDKAKKHWGDLSDSVHSGSVQALGVPTKEEAFDFFTKVWPSAPTTNLPSFQQKRRFKDEDAKKKKQRRGGSREAASGDSDEDMDGDNSDVDDRYCTKWKLKILQGRLLY